MTIGILGGGQLGRMLALAGYPLGMNFRAMDTSPEAVTSHLSDFHHSDFSSEDDLLRFASGVDVVTFEFENVPVDAVRLLEERKPVRPGSRALEVAQDRLQEKRFFRSIDIPTADFRAVDSEEDLHRAAQELGYPAVLKTRRFGYDGKGQALLSGDEDIAAAWKRLGAHPLILEEFISFDREFSVIAARSPSGAFVSYPLAENMHRHGILNRTICPSPHADDALGESAREAIHRAMWELEYVGVLAIEFFAADGRLIANEMAPRVHNSGHWSIDGALTSQFENHLRAIANLPLGDTAPRSHSVMDNIIGTIPDVRSALAIPRARVHLYGKTPLPGRKLGHITSIAPDAGTALNTADEIRRRCGMPKIG